jgi:hypothetical protein
VAPDTNSTRHRPHRRRALALLAATALMGGLAACDLTPVLELEVDTPLDLVDVAPGDGTCATVLDTCSLRAAISEANATPGLVRVTIAPGVDPTLAIPGTNDDINASGDLDVIGNLVIDGQGSTIDAAGIDRVLHVRSGTLWLRDVTVTGGTTAAPVLAGGAIYAEGSLDLWQTTISGTTGGSVYAVGPRLTVSESTVADNLPSAGFGLEPAVSSSAGSVSIVRSLIDHDEGALFVSAGEAVVLDSTVRSDATAVRVLGSAPSYVMRSTLVTTGTAVGDAALDAGASTSVGASILSAPSGAPSAACTAAVTSGGYNVVADTSCGLGATGDLTSTDPLLGPLADNGGPTRTMAVYEGSPAIDLVPATEALCTLVPLDQRGVARPAGGACDAGAVEGDGGPVPPTSFTVDTALDGVDSAPGDGACATAGGACSLRAAVMEVNALGGPGAGPAASVTIEAGIDPLLTLAGPGEDGGTAGDLDLTAAIEVNGNGATIDGGGLDRVFHAHGVAVTLRNLTVTGGDAWGPGGGLLASTAATVTLEEVHVMGNHAASYGGGVAALDLTIHRSTISDNTAATKGGGLHARDLEITDSTAAGNGATASGGGALVTRTATVTGSTFSGNTAGTSGGAIALEPALLTGHVDLVNSTVSANHASTVASGVAAPGTFGPGLTATASTIAGNTGAPGVLATGEHCTSPGNCTTWDATVASGSILTGTLDHPACAGPLGTASTTNLAPDGSCGDTLAGTGDLGPLADNGGPTLTHLPVSGSGAVDVIAPGTAALCDGTIATDQRGVARPAGAGCDVGAVEQ